jgi:hypothetical protein
LPKPTANDVWYSRQPLGKNKLGIIMKTMALTAELYGFFELNDSPFDRKVQQLRPLFSL